MVKVNGRRLKVIKGRKASANVVLENLPCGKGATTIEVTVTLADGKTVTARHSYHLCA
jgi:tripartite-type tricarboxylate transporter receptor subunit TctC